MLKDEIPLTLLARELKELTGRPWQRRKLWEAAVDARIPAERDASGRWTVQRAHLPQIAAALTPVS